MSGMLDANPGRAKFSTIERKAKSAVESLDLNRGELKRAIVPMVIIASELVRSIADRKGKKGTQIMVITYACGYLEQKMMGNREIGNIVPSPDFLLNFENCLKVGLSYRLFDEKNRRAFALGRHYVMLAESHNRKTTK